jgi:asparagine synthetase B (glutamine-hydrolysing)
VSGIIDEVGQLNNNGIPIDGLTYRGPDNRQVWSNSRNCTFGKTCLSIIDLDPCGCPRDFSPAINQDRY